MPFIRIKPSNLDSSNDFSSFVGSAYGTANSAALYANAAFLRANAAFVAANSGSGGSGISINGQTIITRNYAGTGSQLNFAVTSGISTNNVILILSGAVQSPGSDYTISGNTLTFITAPRSNDVIQIREFTSVGNSLDNLIINPFLLMGA